MSRHAILGSNIPLCQSPCKALPRTAGVIQHTQVFTKNRSAAGGGSWWDPPSFHNSSTDSCLKWRLSPPSALYLFVRLTGPTSAVTICSHADPEPGLQPPRSALQKLSPSNTTAAQVPADKIPFCMCQTAAKANPTCYFITYLSLQKILR